jgi:hypothetical protein
LRTIDGKTTLEENSQINVLGERSFMVKKSVSLIVLLLLVAGFLAFTGKPVYSPAYPVLVADKRVDKTSAYLGEEVTVTIDVAGTGTPVTEPDILITHPADIVIMMDASGSYSREITDIKTKFADLLSDLQTAGLDINVGFIVFGNFIYFGECPINTDGSVNTKSVKQLTSDTSSIISFINTLTAAGQWEPWGDAIWLGNNWMSWRPEAYKIVVLATDEPCDEGRRVPGPLGRTTGVDYDGSALWSQVSAAATQDIKYITIHSDERVLSEQQMKRVAQLTDGLFYNFSHAQAEQFVSVINETITEVVKGEQKETAGYNVVVTDIVTPDVAILPGSFSLPPTSQITNPDGSITLTWNLGDIKYDESVTLTYQVRMIRCGAIQTNVDADVTYMNWEGKAAAIQLPLPVVTVPCPTIESTDSLANHKDSFHLDETVYVNGSSYPPSKLFNLYIVEDVTTWTDGMLIPARVPGTVATVGSNSLGNIFAEIGWNPTLTLGGFDIVVDVDNNGVYNTRADALDDNDIDSTAGFIVITVPEPPVAAFTESAHTAPADTLIIFNASSSYDPDGEIILYEWDFDGDGTYDATGAIISHAYPMPGNYTVTLRVTDNDGYTDTATDMKIIVPGGVIPEIPWGSIMASVTMIMAFAAYFTIPKLRKKTGSITSSLRSFLSLS